MKNLSQQDENKGNHYDLFNPNPNVAIEDAGIGFMLGEAFKRICMYPHIGLDGKNELSKAVNEINYFKEYMMRIKHTHVFSRVKIINSYERKVERIRAQSLVSWIESNENYISEEQSYCLLNLYLIQISQDYEPIANQLIISLNKMNE